MALPAADIPPADPQESARAVGLRYVNDRGPGLRRRRAGRGFLYVGPGGRVRDRDTLARIRRLAIPPAWVDVWICPIANGHLQATGRDARGRKQYRYHARWRVVRDEAKYGRLILFARALPRARARVERDLALPGLQREKVLATIVRLLETTMVRVGNEEYVRANGSYGLTTLRNRHVQVDGSTLRFRFRGKSGKAHEVAVADRRVARIVRRCQELPGYELFEWLDQDGQIRSVESGDVNAYLREIVDEDFTAKDFRTWAASVLAARALAACPRCRSAREAKRLLVSAVGDVAAQLGNTAAVCRKSYIHPAILEAWLELPRTPVPPLDEPVAGLRPEENALLALLEARAAADSTPQRARGAA